ncbi:hypothetical protein [Pseudomonas cannabina]|uniref:hypothetical protein n=1 Tax=Pseudomonas cannabina TaxID=86840 RepID=UPI0011C40F32|nr:hypothetical protein [Pseudomonas cannabina]
MNTMEAAKERLLSPAFWRTGSVVGVALIAVLGIQSSNWVRDIDAASANARADIKAQFSTEAWAIEMWERCRSNEGEFADSRTVLLSDCDKAVMRAAGERGRSVEQSVVSVLAAQHDAVRVSIKDVSPEWPLSVFQAPLGRLASWVISNR